MDISTSGVERLLQSQMYPIVLLIKFKNPKQIREIKDLSIKDLRCDKISQKAAKELYEHSLKVENEYKHVITGWSMFDKKVSNQFLSIYFLYLSFTSVRPWRNKHFIFGNPSQDRG